MQADREVAYFIQKQGASAGSLEFTRPAFAGIGKGTFFMSEQFAFEKGFTDGSHVHVDHFPAAAERQAVYFSGEHFFTCTVLASDKDIRIRFGNLGHDLDQFHHNGGVADDHGWLHRAVGSVTIGLLFDLFPFYGL